MVKGEGVRQRKRTKYSTKKEESINKAKTISRENDSRSKKITDWDETAKQLSHAIMWLIIAWDAKPNTPLFEFMDDILNLRQSYNKYSV